MNDLPLWIQTGAGYFLRVQFVPVARNHGHTIGIGESLSAFPLPHHRAYGSVHGDSVG